MKNIAIIGSTGSIGSNTLRVVRAHPGSFRMISLAARSRAEKLLEQALEFRPKVVCLYDAEKAKWLAGKLKSYRIQVVSGPDGLAEASTHPEIEQVIFATAGSVGLRSLFAAVDAGKHIAVANKEPLVMAGELLMRKVEKKGIQLLPIDSEHSGLWQCLEGRFRGTVKRLILTSSGGPFFNRKGSLRAIKPQEALKHPRWKMGPKITIDSATLMNKSLEVIEACHLFGVSMDQIDVVIHPQAVVHALLEFVDGSHLAQLAVTDMRLPIQYALSYPERFVNSVPRLKLTEMESLRFFKPDWKRFPCLQLGYEAGRIGGTMPAVLNAANEVAVQKFLDRTISFPRIYEVISSTMKRCRSKKDPSLDEILSTDAWARETAESLC